MKNDEKSEEELTCSFKIDIRHLKNFDSRAGKVSKFCILMECFLSKYMMFELKKDRGFTFRNTRVWCKIWRKTDLWFEKWQEEFGKFSPVHTKVSKLGLSLGHFIQSRKCMSLKLTGEFCVATTKNDAKCQKGIDLPVQKWH